MPRGRKAARSAPVADAQDTLLYGRVSSDDQEKAGTIRNQQDFLRNYVRLYGLNVVAELWDEGVSGTIPLANRPHGRELLALAEAHPGATVLVYRVDRLGRSLTALLDAHTVLAKAGVLVKSATEPFDTSTPMGKFMFQLLGSLAEMERSTIIERTLMGRARVARGGGWAGEAVALGYALEVDPDETARRKRPAYRRIPYRPHVSVVQAMLRALIDARGSAYRAAQALKRAGVTIPPFEPGVAEVMRGRSFLKVAGPDGERKTATVEDRCLPITPRMIESAARNRLYEGVLTWAGEEVGRDERLAVVDPELLAEARRVLDGPAPRPRGRAASSGAEPLALTGLAYCLGPEDHPHETPHLLGCRAAARAYVCEKGYRNGGERSCLDAPARVLDEAVAAFVLGQLRPDATLADDVVAGLEREQADAASRAEERDRSRRRLRKEIATLEANYRVLLASTRLTPKRLAQVEDTIAAKQAELDGLASEAPAPVQRHLDAHRAATVRDLLAGVDAAWPTMRGAARNDFLSLFLERVEVAHCGATLAATVRWVGGREQVIAIDRPGYRPSTEAGWTDAELAVLRTDFATAPWPDLLERLPGRSAKAIATKAAALSLTRAPVTRAGRPIAARRRFTAADDEMVRRYARGGLNLDQLCAQLDRPGQAIHDRMTRLGLRREGPRSLATVGWRIVSDNSLMEVETGSRSGYAFDVLEVLLASPERACRLTALGQLTEP